MIEHGSDEITIATDGTEGLGTMDVPGDFVKHGLEHVDGDEADARFNQTACQQAALAETVQTITLADLFGFLGEFKCFASFLRRHKGVRLMEGGIEQAGIL